MDGNSGMETEPYISGGYEYFNETNSGICPTCGMSFPLGSRGRPKRFCSEKCRTLYHHRFPNQKNWKSTRKVVCPVCGKEFVASREYGHPRKYCSRACANKGRALERKGMLPEPEQDQDST